MDQLRLQLADVDARLKAALLTGAHTAGLRQERSSILALIAREADDAEAVNADAEAAENEKLVQRAALIAADSQARLDSRMAGLAIPAHP
jgi:hypothetical protein